MGRVVRVAVLGPLLAALFSAGGVASNAALPGRPACADAAWTHRASLVVEHADGRVLRVCVGFDAATITGDQLLAASGVQSSTLGTSSFGKEVCQVDGEPATYPNTCWTTTSPYWVMFVSRAGGAWIASALGVSSQTFADGDAEGFRYDAQTGPEAPPPSPAGTCGLTQPSAVPVPTSLSAARTPRPTPAPIAAATPLAGTGKSPPPLPATPGVVSASLPSPTPTAAAAQPAAAGAALGPLVAAAGGGGLLGLLILSMWRARRR